MCGCQMHSDSRANCTCICPEHHNFELAAELASMRYDQIQVLESRIATLETSLNAYRDLAPDTVPGHTHKGGEDMYCSRCVSYGCEKGLVIFTQQIRELPPLQQMTVVTSLLDKHVNVE